MIVSCASKPQGKNNAPAWFSYESINQVFPEKEYLARIGSGENPQTAQLNADAELSAYFNQKIKTITQAEEKFSNTNNSTSSQKNLTRSVIISSNSELIGLKHTDCFFNKKENRYYICSYINRKETWELIEPKIKSYAIKFENAKQNIENETEPFNKIIIQNKILKEKEIFYNLYYIALGLLPEKAEKYFYLDSELQKLTYDNLSLKKTIKIHFISEGDITNRITTKAEELLSNEGFTISQSKSNYIAKLAVNTTATKSGDIYIIYPQIQITMEKANTTTLANFSKQLGKVSSYTKEAAERLALNKLETELETNFINNLLNTWSE